MTIHFGAVPAGAVLPVHFGSYNSAGASVALTGLAVTDVEIYKDTSMTQRASDAGVVLLDTDGIDIDGIVGANGLSIDTGNNTDAGFYAVGSFFNVWVASVTVDGQTVNFLAATFRLVAAEAIAGKPKADVDAWLGTAPATPTVAGVPEVDVTHELGRSIQTVFDTTSANGAADGSTAVDTSRTEANDFWNDVVLFVPRGGTNLGLNRRVVDWVNATGTYFFDTPFPNQVVITTDYELVVCQGSVKTVTGNVDGNVSGNITGNVLGSVDNVVDPVQVSVLQAGAIVAASFAAGAIDATAIADNAIDAGAIATGAITSAKFAASAINAAAIATDAITAAKIAADAITAAKIADGAIDAATFAAGAINAAAIANGAIDAATFAAGAIDAAAIADNAIDAASIATGAITAAKFAAGAIDAAAIAAAAITAAKFAANAVDANALAANAVDEILDEVVEGTTTFRQILMLVAAASAGKASGLDTTNAIYRNIADTLNRIDATVDANGNRTAVTLNLTP